MSTEPGEVRDGFMEERSHVFPFQGFSRLSFVSQQLFPSPPTPCGEELVINTKGINGQDSVGIRPWVKLYDEADGKVEVGSLYLCGGGSPVKNLKV